MLQLHPISATLLLAAIAIASAGASVYVVGVIAGVAFAIELLFTIGASEQVGSGSA